MVSPHIRPLPSIPPVWNRGVQGDTYSAGFAGAVVVTGAGLFAVAGAVASAVTAHGECFFVFVENRGDVSVLVDFRVEMMLRNVGDDWGRVGLYRADGGGIAS